MSRAVAVVIGWTLALGAFAAACAQSDDLSSHGPVFDDLDGSAPGEDSGSRMDVVTTHVDARADGAGDVADGPSGAEGGAVGDDSGEAQLDAVAPEDASDAGAGSDCGSMIAVLAGGASSLSGAVATGTAGFSVQSINGASIALAPALVWTGTGFEALVATSGDAGGGYPLAGLGFTGSWSAPAALGGAVSAIDAPAAALVGSNVEAAYLNPQHVYFHAEWSAGTWNAGSDAVTPSGGVQSFGPVRASAASTGSELVIAYEGDDGHLYAQSWTASGKWQTAVEVGGADAGALATNTPPALVALGSGGTYDLLVVYDAPANPPSEEHIYYALRTASSKAWSYPVAIDATIYSSDPPVLAALSGGRALLAWRGASPQQAYTAEFDPSGATPWKAAVSIGSTIISVPPSLATGTCGSDAVAALVSGGTVSIATYAGGHWATATPVAGIGSAQFATVATSP